MRICFLRLLQMQQQMISMMSRRAMPSMVSKEKSDCCIMKVKMRRTNKPKINHTPPPAPTKIQMLMPHSMSGKTKPVKGKRKRGERAYCVQRKLVVRLKQNKCVFQKCLRKSSNKSGKIKKKAPLNSYLNVSIINTFRNKYINVS